VKTLYLAAGWILIGVAALLAVATHRADRRMQAPVGRAWQLSVLVYAVAILGMILVSLGVEALP
jgi:hypothetical protein